MQVIDNLHVNHKSKEDLTRYALIHAQYTNPAVLHTNHD